MNVLLLGSGGREHALAWKISQSKLLTSLFIAPGNAGTAKVGTNISLSVLDFPSIKTAVLEHHIRMVIVGPEDPLVMGIYDYFLSDPDLRQIPVIGPSKIGAMLEGSKDFAKKFMFRHHIPTAGYASFDSSSVSEGIEFLRSLPSPYVLKADGLAAGKGVLICSDIDEAIGEFSSVLTEKRFGSASDKVIIEEFLKGLELPDIQPRLLRNRINPYLLTFLKIIIDEICNIVKMTIGDIF